MNQNKINRRMRRILRREIDNAKHLHQCAVDDMATHDFGSSRFNLAQSTATWLATHVGELQKKLSELNKESTQ